MNKVRSLVLDVGMSLQRRVLSEAFAASLLRTTIRPGRNRMKTQGNLWGEKCALDASMQPSVSCAVGLPCEGLLTYVTCSFWLRLYQLQRNPRFKNTELTVFMIIMLQFSCS